MVYVKGLVVIKRALCLTVFIVYILVVLKLTLFRANIHYAERQLNLTLFADLLNVYRNVGVVPFLRLFLGNIGWFVPFGFLLPLLQKKSGLVKTMAAGFTFSLFIEIMQFIFHKGVAELDDLILNTLGAAIGYLLCRLFIKNKKAAPTDSQNTQKA